MNCTKMLIAIAFRLPDEEDQASGMMDKDKAVQGTNTSNITFLYYGV